MIPLHYDYVLGPPMTSLDADWTGQTDLQTVAPGALIQGIPLNLEPDAPFLLRSIAVRYTYPTMKSCQRTQPGLTGLRIRFTGPNANYLQQGYVPVNLMMAYGGQLGNPAAVWREVYYPPQATILLDLSNDSTSTLSNLTFYFRGVKLFAPGQRPSYTYPDPMSTRMFRYPLTVGSLGVTESRWNIPFTAVQDSDFVLRAAQAGTQDKAFFEVFFRLRDENHYPFSSRPVHVDTLFGQAGDTPQYSAGSDTTVVPYEVGPANPGLWFPEIYVPRQHQLFYDVYRNDAAYSTCTAGSEDYPITLIGAKVFPQ
jgi:hypothetical protein